MAGWGTRNWQKVRVSANLSSFPEELDLSPSRIAAAFLLVCSTSWIGGVLIVIGDENATWKADEMAILAMSLLFGAVYLVWGITLLVRKRRAVLHADGVEVDGRGLLGKESWYSPYGAFKGVLHRRVVVKSESNTTAYQVIELLHEDAGKCIPLYVRRSSDMPRARWETYARQLKLPALESEEGCLSARRHDELDKSLKERVAGGAAGHSFDPDAPAPAGLVVTRDGADAFTIAITVPRFPAWFLVIFIPIGLAVLAGSVLGDGNPVLLFATGVFFASFPAYALYRDRTSSRTLRLDRDRLSIDDRMRSRRDVEALVLGEIESIALRVEDGRLGRGLIIAGDRGRMHVGAGLSREALAWLKNFLTAAIATA